MSKVIDVDLSSYFDTIQHAKQLSLIAKQVQDPQVLGLIKQIIKVTGKVGVPQGGPFSPLAANIYLNKVDWTFDAIRRDLTKRLITTAFQTILLLRSAVQQQTRLG